ncbi:M56 family metallopeptidase [Paenibacillus periandrae]|uniref:M56 family metallopeptidase n=1 Tax=Paenibacillus periandrae TaxID=1761741 RepID=UPI001F08FBAD|nr:M56 family metallopeptidase [Paenibacillus periandrae]
MDIVNNIFVWFVYATFAASIVALLVISIQKLFHRYMNARIRHALWLIVLIRLLLPVFPNSDVSIFNMVPFATELSKAAAGIVSFVQIDLSNNGTRINQQDELLPNDNSRLSQDYVHMEPTLSTQRMEDSEPASVQSHNFGLKILAPVWLIGVVTILTYLIYCMVKMRRRFSTLRLVTDSSIMQVMDECRAKFGISLPIPVYTGNFGISPYISGVIHPWIYLPEAIGKELSPSQLSHVLSHELAHYRRKDMAWNTIGSLILAIHWMNPLVWICIRMMKADRELACDAYVLEVLGEAEAIPYGLTIIEFLKRFSAKRNQPNLLYFHESNNHNQIARRMTMIKSFKKGSYKLSAIAIIGMAILAAVTLTNSHNPLLAISTDNTLAAAETTMKDRILFDSPFRDYNRLDKAARIADFKFKVPNILPEDYKFESVHLNSKQPEESKLTKASLFYEARQGNKNYGNFKLNAVFGGNGLEAAYAIIEQSEQQLKIGEFEIKKEPLIIQHMDVLKVTVGSGKREKLYYIWQDQDIQYQLYGNVSNQDFLTMIGSMKYPDEQMNERYTSDYMLNIQIYDTDDLQQAPELIGFTPKFPLQLLGQFQATNAFVTKKVNFSYPIDDEDKNTRLLSIRYQKTDNNNRTVNSFSFKQIKNGHTYQDIKNSGYVDFYRIDGQKHEVKVSPIEVAGMEVLKTEKYKIDGPLSGANEADFVSYFWIENDVCFQVNFKENESQQNEIVAYLINAKAADLNKMN